jgi:aspartate aminotransferase-like enzyme
MKASLEEIFEEGVENVFRRHRIASKAVRAAVRAMGLGVVAREEDVAWSCTTVIWPEGFDIGEMNRRMYQGYGVTFGGHRIGTMGFVARPGFVLPAISALEETMCAMGYDVEIGVGVRAANEVFAAAE